MKLFRTGCPPRVKPNADILVRVKITSVENPDADIKKDDEMNDVKFEKTSFKKLYKEALKNYSSAYASFSHQNYAAAINIYHHWIFKLEKSRLTSDDEEQKQKQLLIKMYQNICICYNKTNKPKKTCLMMRELEKLTSINNNPKALFAKGKANMMLNDFQYARKNFLMAAKLIPNDSGIVAAIEELNEREERQAQYNAESADNIKMFKQEAFEAEERKRIGYELEKQKQEKLEMKLKNFKGMFQDLIQELINDVDIQRLSLNSDYWTHHHLTLAEDICKQHDINLKGFESAKGTFNFYYLCK